MYQCSNVHPALTMSICLNLPLTLGSLKHSSGARLLAEIEETKALPAKRRKEQPGPEKKLDVGVIVSGKVAAVQPTQVELTLGGNAIFNVFHLLGGFSIPMLIAVQVALLSWQRKTKIAHRQIGRCVRPILKNVPLCDSFV